MLLDGAMLSGYCGQGSRLRAHRSGPTVSYVAGIAGQQFARTGVATWALSHPARTSLEWMSRPLQN